MKIRGFVTGQTPPMGDVNQRSFQDSLLGRPQSQSFRETDNGLLRVQNFAGLEKVYFDPTPETKEVAKDFISYLLLIGYTDLVEHVYPTDSTYEATISVEIADPKLDSCPILTRLAYPYANFRSFLGGTLGLMTTDFGRMMIWCETIKKFVLLLWVNYDTTNKLWLLHMDLDGIVTKAAAILTTNYPEDYASTYCLKNFTTTSKSGKVQDFPYILCFQSGATYSARRVLAFNASTLAVTRNTECDRIPVLVENGTTIYQFPAWDGPAYLYRSAAFMNNGMLVEGRVNSGTYWGRLLSYSKRNPLPVPKTLYDRPFSTDVPPLYTIDYLRTRNLICIGGASSGSNTSPSLVMDTTGKILYYLATGAGVANTTPCQEMLRRK